MRLPHTERFMGAYVGLALVATAGVFFFLLKVGGSAYRQQAEAPDPLGSWSTARIMEELGDYDTKVPDCAGMVQGMTGYAYAKFNSVTGEVTRVIIVCR